MGCLHSMGFHLECLFIHIQNERDWSNFLCEWVGIGQTFRSSGSDWSDFLCEWVGIG